MSDDEDLAREARSLLAAVQVPLATPPEVRARALRRLDLALPLPGSDPGDAPGTGAPSSTNAPTNALTDVLRRALASRVPAWTLALGFAAGGLAGAALVGRASPPTAPPEAPAVAMSASSSRTSPELRVSPTTTASVPVPPSASTESPVLAPTAAAPSARASAVARGDALPAESALLDVARTALGRGDGENALAATDAHARKFPRGALSEEREAIRIQALRLLHRDDEANAKLDRFRARFPTSLLRPALEATDAGGP